EPVPALLALLAPLLLLPPQAARATASAPAPTAATSLCRITSHPLVVLQMCRPRPHTDLALSCAEHSLCPGYGLSPVGAIRSRSGNDSAGGLSAGIGAGIRWSGGAAGWNGPSPTPEPSRRQDARGGQADQAVGEDPTRPWRDRHVQRCAQHGA